MKKQKTSRNRGELLLMVGPTAMWLLLFLLIPLVYVVYISFCQRGIGGVGVKDIDFSGNIFENYISIFTNSLNLQSTLQSLLMAFETCAICLVVGYPFAWFLCKLPRNVRGIMQLLLILPFWVSALLRLNGWVNIIRETGVLNTVLTDLGIITEPLQLHYTDGSVLLGMVYCFFPFMVLPLQTSISKLDHSLIEASMDLGAKRISTFRRVILPQTLPGIFAGTIQVFIPSLGAYFVKEIMGGQSVLLGDRIRDAFGMARNWPLGAAFAVILIIFTLIVLKMYSKVGSLDDLA